jgi:hypothetical protein
VLFLLSYARYNPVQSLARVLSNPTISSSLLNFHAPKAHEMIYKICGVVDMRSL